MSGTSEGGRRAHFAGKRFEEWLDEQHDLAKRLGLLAHAEHTQARTKVVGQRLIYERRGVADYVLCLSGGGYAAVEAKSDEGGRIRRDRVSPEQSRHLDATARGGGVALLLVEFRLWWGNQPAPPCRAAIPWVSVPWTTPRSAEGLSYQDALPWAIPVGACYLSPYTAPMYDGEGSVIDFRPKQVYPRE